MEAQGQEPDGPSQVTERSTEPVRSRWTPKPEQILILESIFNSGMVNPSKDETVRIRKLLEKYGAVGDANVFYWFQNRRSRSRRRQRQLQASLASEQRNQAQVGGGIPYECSSAVGFRPPTASFASTPCSYLVGSSASSSCGINHTSGGAGNVFPASSHVGFPESNHTSPVNSILCPPENQNLHYHSGNITVFVNGVPTEVPRGQIDMKTVIGQDVILVHSSGVPVPINEFGFLVESLQPGESYFLVPRPT